MGWNLFQFLFRVEYEESLENLYFVPTQLKYLVITAYNILLAFF